MKITLYFNAETNMFHNLETDSTYPVSAIQTLRQAGFDVDIDYSVF